MNKRAVTHCVLSPLILSVYGGQVCPFMESLAPLQLIGILLAGFLVADELLSQGEQGLKPGGSRRDLVILVSDIRDFTTTSEAPTPEQVVADLNRYFSRMVEKTMVSLTSSLGTACWHTMVSAATAGQRPGRCVRLWKCSTP